MSSLIGLLIIFGYIIGMPLFLIWFNHLTTCMNQEDVPIEPDTEYKHLVSVLIHLDSVIRILDYAYDKGIDSTYGPRDSIADIRNHILIVAQKRMKIQGRKLKNPKITNIRKNDG